MYRESVMREFTEQGELPYDSEGRGPATLYTCDSCGALVTYEHAPQHFEWHTQQRVVLANLHQTLTGEKS
jgi:hypothetical protein